MIEHKCLSRYPLGNPRRIWRQENLILSIENPGPVGLQYSGEEYARITERAVHTCKEAGFDTVETCWASPEMGKVILETAEKLGIGVVYQDLTRFGGMGDKNVFCKTNDLLGAMRDTKDYRCIKGYYMWDEPTFDEQMVETGRMITECEAERPGMLPFTVALPSYHKLKRWEDGNYVPYVERFADLIDPAQLSFDHYPVGLKPYDEAIQLDESLMWCDIEVVRRAAQKRKIPFWFCYQGHKFPFYKFDAPFTGEMVRMMANAAILHGAVQLTCYVELDGVVDPKTGGHGIYFDVYQKFLGELAALGNTLMALECRRVIHDDSLLPECPYMKDLRVSMEESELLEGELPKRISVSESCDAYGNRYLMVLNRDCVNETAFVLKLKERSNVYVVSKRDGKQRLDDEHACAIVGYLEAGGLALYRIQSDSEEPYTVEYCLSK